MKCIEKTRSERHGVHLSLIHIWVLAMQPRYLVLDEPLAGLDPGGKAELMETICTLHREQGVAVIMVSHDMDEVAAAADRILVMHQGEVAAFDTPERVFSDAGALQELGLALPQTAAFALSLIHI